MSSSIMFVDTDGQDGHANHMNLPSSGPTVNQQCNRIARLTQRMNGYRDHHDKCETIYSATSDAINAKIGHDTQQLRQQYIKNTSASSGPKSKNSKANGGGGRGGGNKRSNAAANNNNNSSTANGVNSSSNNQVNHQNGDSTDGHQPSKATKVPKLTPKASPSPSSNVASLLPSYASSTTPSPCGDYKNIDLKPNAAAMTSNSSSISNNLVTPPSRPSSSSLPPIIMPEIKREAVEFEALNATDLQDYLPFAGPTVSSVNNYGIDVMAADPMKDVSFDCLLEGLSDEFIGDDEFIKKFLEDLSHTGNNLPGNPNIGGHANKPTIGQPASQLLSQMAQQPQVNHTSYTPYVQQQSSHQVFSQQSYQYTGPPQAQLHQQAQVLRPNGYVPMQAQRPGVHATQVTQVNGRPGPTQQAPRPTGHVVMPQGVRPSGHSSQQHQAQPPSGYAGLSHQSPVTRPNYGPGPILQQQQQQQVPRPNGYCSPPQQAPSRPNGYPSSVQQSQPPNGYSNGPPQQISQPNGYGVMSQASGQPGYGGPPQAQQQATGQQNGFVSPSAQQQQPGPPNSVSYNGQAVPQQSGHVNGYGASRPGLIPNPGARGPGPPPPNHHHHGQYTQQQPQRPPMPQMQQPYGGGYETSQAQPLPSSQQQQQHDQMSSYHYPHHSMYQYANQFE
ncbi:hypothetical protein HDE_04640 [Halotydeus destructor]|nr:hypothetical protein HDE_04640 [Halotydeus destructor]